MKRFSTILAFAILLTAVTACSKKSSPDPNINSPDPDKPTSGVTTGNTTNYNGYIVKTIGISRIRAAIDKNDKLINAEFVGGGNRVVVRAGSDAAMSFEYGHYVPRIETYADAEPTAKYAVGIDIDNSKVIDTAGVVIRLKGFDKTKDGFNQLNVVLCAETGVKTDYNIVYTEFHSDLPKSAFNNEYFKKLFSGPVKATTVDVAPTTNNYIIRNMVASSCFVNVLETGLTNDIDLWDQWGSAIIKLTSSGKEAINVGGPIQTELVNADKGQLSYIPRVYNGTYYNPTFSNLLESGFATIAEEPDATNKVYLKISGFDPKICGFNELRIFLIQDLIFNESGPLDYGGLKRDEKYTLDYIQQTTKTKNMYCIQMNTQ